MAFCASSSPIAVSPLAPAGLGLNHVPDASMTLSASSESVPAPFRYRIENGALSRPLVLTLSKPARLIATTRLDVCT